MMEFLGELVRADGIEPTSLAWKARVLPLNYARERIYTSKAEIFSESSIDC